MVRRADFRSGCDRWVCVAFSNPPFRTLAFRLYFALSFGFRVFYFGLCDGIAGPLNEAIDVGRGIFRPFALADGRGAFNKAAGPPHFNNLAFPSRRGGVPGLRTLRGSRNPKRRDSAPPSSGGDNSVTI